MAYCHNCGQAIYENAAFCPGCGASQPVPAASPASGSTGPKPSKAIFWYILGLLLLLVSLIALSASSIGKFPAFFAGSTQELEEGSPGEGWEVRQDPASADPSPSIDGGTADSGLGSQSGNMVDTDTPVFEEGPEYSPSFDCSRGASAIEQVICSDPTLARLDRAMSDNYRAMLASDIGDGARQDLKSTQRAWIRQRDRCTDRSCLVDVYRTRIDAICDYPVISGVYPICTTSDDID